MVFGEKRDDDARVTGRFVACSMSRPIGTTVGLILEPQDGQENHQFEIGQRGVGIC